MLEHLAETVVFVSLCGLIGISSYQLRAIHSSLSYINEVLEPATRASSDLLFALSREAASTRAFLLTGRTEYQAEFEQSRAARHDALRRLSQLSDRDVAGLETLLAEESRQLSAADRRLDALYAGTIDREQYLADFPDQHRRFNAVIGAAAALHQRLRASATQGRKDVEETERLGMLLEIGGIALAIVAGFSVVRLKGRERAARIASDQAQADADRRRAQIEQSTARWMRLIRGFTHDVKNPLNAADGYLFMMESGVTGPLAPAQLRAIEKCRRGVQGAVALTVDLVDLARAETADVDVRRTEINLPEIVAGVVDDYRAQAAAKGLAVAAELPPHFDPIRSDRMRIAQILGNLVGNAVKYTDAGTITVRLQRRPDATGNERIAVEVSDTGRGIAPQDRQRIFAEFEQVEPGAPTGTGIGLAISERLAHTLDGRITLESEEGKGSTFILWLPPS